MSKTKKELKVDWATHEAAKYACRNWHYTKSLPVPPLVKIGVWEEGEFVGVVIFSRGASCNLLKPYGLSQRQGCELTRIAMKQHEVPVSKVISLAIKFLKKISPELELIVSFADPSEGHHGGVYQATNWIYTGKSSPSFSYIDSKGKKYHSRQVSEKGFNIQQGVMRKCPKPSELKKVFNEGKHRYIFPLKNREKYLKLSKPYPKRVKHLGDASLNHREESSSSLTDSLQKASEELKIKIRMRVKS